MLSTPRTLFIGKIHTELATLATVYIGDREYKQGSVLVQIDSSFFGHGRKTALLQGLDCFSRQLQRYPTLSFRPPHPLLLKIGLLQFLGAAVRVRNRKGVVCFLTSQVTNAGHNNSFMDGHELSS
jgi:hypothetical protein